MKMNDYAQMTVGDIVSHDSAAAYVFDRFGIDFCCGGNRLLSEVCEKGGIRLEDVVARLSAPKREMPTEHLAFYRWPLDLLVDYVLKIYHRNWKAGALKIKDLAHKVAEVHGETHPELLEVRDLFDAALTALEEHFDKEEQILFPYIYELVQAVENKTPVPEFHCGSISFPIAVMEDDHEAEGERFKYMRKITNGFTAPQDGCASYRLLMEELDRFEQHLHRHIHLENNLIFPQAIELQNSHMAS
ncbi:Cell wall-related protein ScdA [Porphyromonas macacae]|uniref:Cell wall-related protein ScdA n=1 Tax=Porphyromonas macacae TaxID=28115 RepID=A0A379E7M0_9PORP|nr:iron-sulfur cluster repair di-iron protein [Porphyromonas macacae]SUB88717.1 Cell wall-related protein ScdA [Porphyromonas macacae]